MARRILTPVTAPASQPTPIVLRPFDPERIARELPAQIEDMERALAKLRDCQKIAREILDWEVTI